MRYEFVSDTDNYSGWKPVHFLTTDDDGVEDTLFFHAQHRQYRSLGAPGQKNDKTGEELRKSNDPDAYRQNPDYDVNPQEYNRWKQPVMQSTIDKMRPLFDVSPELK